MTGEPEPTDVASPPPIEPSITTEERLRRRVSMLAQLLGVAAAVVVLQFGIMIKVLMESR
jgi:hypothetical protein